MRSNDPSPWAAEPNEFEEEAEATAILMARADEDYRRRIMQERLEAALWERFAPRLTANGGLVR